MSGSEMGTREQFPLGFHKPQPQPQQLPNVRLDYASDGAAVFKAAPPFHQSPTVAAHVNGGETVAAVPQGSMGLGQAQVGGSSNEPLKRKRGRPRKYGPDGAMSLALTNTSPPPAPAPAPAPAAAAAAAAPTPPPPHPHPHPHPPPPPPHLHFSPGPVNQPGGPFSPPPAPPAPPPASASPGSSKKSRGRPRGSRNKTYSKRRDSGSRGGSITPHVITVNPGEDLSSRIFALSQNGPRNVCILSANGAISNVTLHQPAASGGNVTYEGRFEILSLSGSLFPNENGSQHSTLGGLSVSLSGPDGRVLGGGVAGLLIAAAPVQLVLGSFLTKETKSAKKMENVSSLTPTAGQSSSPSRGTLSESSDGSGSPLNQSTGACNDNNPPQGISGMPWK